MRSTAPPADFDPDRLEALRGIFAQAELVIFFNLLLDEIEALIEQGPNATAFLDQAHAQRGAALNLGALRIAASLEAIEDGSIGLSRATGVLRDDLVALRAALVNHDVIRRDGGS